MTGNKLLASLALFASVLWPTSADACSCAGSTLPCEAAGQADAIFVGHVVAIASATGSPTSQVELAVVEQFRGLRSPQITLSMGGSNCDYPFTMGESYIVYAHRSQDGQLSTSICTRTRPVAEANEDLAYARSLATIRPGAPARAAGRVQLWEWPVPANFQLKPVPGVEVTARGQGKTFSAHANDRGEFELTGLPLGTFDLRVRAPDGYASVPRSLEIHDPRGCGTTSLLIRHDGRVTGRVVDGRGVGIPGLPLELVPRSDVNSPRVSGNRVQTWTTADGAFELQLVAPGEYVLGFNAIGQMEGKPPRGRVFYPGVVDSGEATAILISAGQRVRVGNFALSDSIKLATVTGIVIDEDSRPVAEAFVVARDKDIPHSPTSVGSHLVTGEDGRFFLTLIDGRKYDVHVTRYAGSDERTRRAQVSVAEFTASAKTPTVTVVVKPSRQQ